METGDKGYYVKSFQNGKKKKYWLEKSLNGKSAPIEVISDHINRLNITKTHKSGVSNLFCP